jgi:hypothetical protein
MEELILRAVDWEKAGRPRDYNGNRYSKYGPQYDYNSIIES